jgi:hypothetical protein
MKKLIEWKNKSISRGMVFRLPAKWPYENFVDFMVVDFSDGHGLIVSSGYKAGLILIILPNESNSNEYVGIDTQWIIDNWSNWIYPDCDVNDVYIIERYESSPV